MTDFGALIGALAEGRVEFIIVGGLAATIHGSSRLTEHVDIVYSRTADNLTRLVEALRPLSPYLRGEPPGLPFDWSVTTLHQGLNFTLTTGRGPLDILGEIVGGGRYEDLLSSTVEITLFSHRVRCLDLHALIASKRAAGRPRDLETLAELEFIDEESKR